MGNQQSLINAIEHLGGDHLDSVTNGMKWSSATCSCFQGLGHFPKASENFVKNYLSLLSTGGEKANYNWYLPRHANVIRKRRRIWTNRRPWLFKGTVKDESLQGIGFVNISITPHGVESAHLRIWARQSIQWNWSILCSQLRSQRCWPINDYAFFTLRQWNHCRQHSNKKNMWVSIPPRKEWWEWIISF